MKMDKDDKEIRRSNFNRKKYKKNDKNYDKDSHQNHRLKKAFKHKRLEIQDEESWEQWRDEVY